MILTAGNLRNLAKILLYHFGHAVIVGVAGLTVGEEGLGILSSTAGDGTLGAHGTVAETLDVLLVHQRTDVFLVHQLNLVVLVRGAETVEEIHKRYAGLKGGKVGGGGHIHHLLNRTLAKHGETGLAARHHILMVTENTQRVAGKRTGGNIEYARYQLTGYLVHVRYHQKKTLRSGERGGQRTGLKRTVNSTGGTGLRLHLLHTHGLTPEVLAATGGPLIHMLGHRR